MLHQRYTMCAHLVYKFANLVYTPRQHWCNVYVSGIVCSAVSAIHPSYVHLLGKHVGIAQYRRVADESSLCDYAEVMSRRGEK
jgi:hypothetical protein